MAALFSAEKRELRFAVYRRDLDHALLLARRIDDGYASTERNRRYEASVRTMNELGLFEGEPLRLQDARITVLPDRFTVHKFRGGSGNYALIGDRRVLGETTLIMKEGEELQENGSMGAAFRFEVNASDLQESEGMWRWIGFDMVLPFDMKGFMQFVSSGLASAGISIMAEAGYGTDHVLVKDDDLRKALRALGEMGFVQN